MAQDTNSPGLGIIIGQQKARIYLIIIVLYWFFQLVHTFILSYTQDIQDVSKVWKHWEKPLIYCIFYFLNLLWFNLSYNLWSFCKCVSEETYNIQTYFPGEQFHDDNEVNSSIFPEF